MMEISDLNVYADDAQNESRRRVTLRRDGDDYIVVFQPENIVALRNPNVNAVRRLCRFLRWEIVSDQSQSELEQALP